MKRTAIILAVLAVVGLATSSAQAGGPYGHGGHSHGGHSHGGYGSYRGGYGGSYGGGYGRSYGGGFRAPVYHGPSVHFDRQYHADYSHWTPGRGFHTHGHYDVVPHYVPGHVDTLHNGHVHGNPWYHH